MYAVKKIASLFTSELLVRLQQKLGLGYDNMTLTNYIQDNTVPKESWRTIVKWCCMYIYHPANSMCDYLHIN